jgi:hypothetical protein
MNQNLEEQIANMLEKVMIDDFDDTRTIDTSTFETVESRKALKAKTHQTDIAGVLCNKYMNQRINSVRKIKTTFLPSSRINEKTLFRGNDDGYSDAENFELPVYQNVMGLNQIHFNMNLNDCVFHKIEKMLMCSNKIDTELYSYLKGHFISIIRTQNGSRIFQKYLNNTSQLIISNIYEEILPFVKDLLLDPYANYFCQKLYGILLFNEKIFWLKAVYIY